MLFKEKIRGVENCSIHDVDYTTLPRSGERCCKLNLTFMDLSCAYIYAEDAKEVKVEAHDAKVKEEYVQELDVVDALVDLEVDFDSGNQSNAKIEPTKAGKEAISRDYKHDDMEEIHELVSATYGAFYNGK